MTQATYFNPRASIWTRSREWKHTHLRAAFEMSMLDEGDDEGTARVVDLAGASLAEIESDIVQSAFPIRNVDDAQAILSIAVTILRDADAQHDAEGRSLALLLSVHRGLNSVRAQIERRAS